MKFNAWKWLRAGVLPLFFGGFMALVCEKEKYDKTKVTGRNRVFLCGKMIVGPDFLFNLFALTFIIGGSITFALIPGVYLTTYNTALGISMFVITKILLTMTLSAWLLAATADPGIVPRSDIIPLDLDEKPENKDKPPREKTKDVIVDGEKRTLKYCETCRIWRPPRSSHCNICDNCVYVFDHHCSFVGNCIGARNYGAFYLFLIDLVLLCVFSLAGSICHLVLFTNSESAAQGISGTRAFSYILANSSAAGSIVISVICFIALVFVGPLFAQHTYLLYINQTTKEMMSKQRRNQSDDKSCKLCCNRCCDQVCGEDLPSKVWESYTPPDEELGGSPTEESSTGMLDDQPKAEAVCSSQAKHVSFQDD